MKKLEDKIIKKVYLLETENSLVKLAVFILLTIVGFLFGTIIYAQLTEQQTWDMLQIFQEDTSIISEYLGQVISDIYLETPKVPLAFFILFLLFIIFSLLIFIKNFARLKKKTQSLLKFWGINL